MTITRTDHETHEMMALTVLASMREGCHEMDPNVATYTHSDGTAKALRAWCVKCNAEATFRDGVVRFRSVMRDCLFPRGVFTKAYGSGA